MSRYEIYRRLESRTPFGDLNRGFRAEVHDPLWFLGRQWQMGEHAGEDASSPVEVHVTSEDVPIDPLLGDGRMDPRIVPPEAIVESEPGDWWTPGRRLRLGREYAIAEGLPAVGGADTALLCSTLPYPYSKFNGAAYDGFKLFQQDSGHAIFADAPQQEPADVWDPAELAYSTTFTAGGRTLALERHDGGHIDWYAVDADDSLPAGPTVTRRVLPTRMRYPGAPHPRWWQIEDSRVDIGGYAPDRGHFATMLLIDLITSHSDDWFTFPHVTTSGSAVRLQQVIVHDSFDDTWEVAAPTDWHMFRVKGLADSTLLAWPTVTAPLTGAILEEVILGVDEDANLLWAVERRANGRDLPTEGLEPETLEDTSGTVDGSARIRYHFREAIGVRRYWHPYTIESVDGRRRYVQGRLADLSQTPPTHMPEPVAQILYDHANLTPNPADQVAPVHQIEPATVPNQGLRLRRRWMLVRQTDGQPRLWVQRERLPLMAPPISGLLFDVFEETPQVVASS